MDTASAAEGKQPVCSIADQCLTKAIAVPRGLDELFETLPQVPVEDYVGIGGCAQDVERELGPEDRGMEEGRALGVLKLVDARGDDALDAVGQ